MSWQSVAGRSADGWRTVGPLRQPSRALAHDGFALRWPAVGAGPLAGPSVREGHRRRVGDCTTDGRFV